VERAILVQRTAVYGYISDYVVDCAVRDPNRFAAVACVNAESGDAPERVNHWIGERGARGIRFAAPSSEREDTSWLSGPKARKAWAALAAQGGSACLLLRQAHQEAGLVATRMLAVDFPEVPIVLDHLGGVATQTDIQDFGIAQNFLDLADRPNIFLKLSSINLRAHEAADRQRLVARIAGIFGAERIMWGSDIGNTGLPYGQMVERALAATANLSEAERHQILYAVANKMYW
jgi:L-fuconolactonase